MIQITLQGPDLHNFLCDVLTTFVEGGLYEWFQVKDYRWFSPTTDGGTAPMFQIGDVVVQNVTGKVRVQNENDDRWGKWQALTPGLAEIGFIRLCKGPVEGLAESYRASILGALLAYDGGKIDLNDADVVMQIATLGSVVFS